MQRDVVPLPEAQFIFIKTNAVLEHLFDPEATRRPTAVLPNLARSHVESFPSERGYLSLRLIGNSLFFVTSVNSFASNAGPPVQNNPPHNALDVHLSRFFFHSIVSKIACGIFPLRTLAPQPTVDRQPAFLCHICKLLRFTSRTNAGPPA
ncbi:hypothetical protein M405DRAFT_857022 [Rhizopogon salebrosus TDB-379]|nr:hypothetical protein M405DRAFT_857022 [Rhizopogon salebrosus TDB-379]